MSMQVSIYGLEGLRSRFRLGSSVSGLGLGLEGSRSRLGGQVLGLGLVGSGLVNIPVKRLKPG